MSGVVLLLSVFHAKQRFHAKPCFSLEFDVPVVKVARNVVHCLAMISDLKDNLSYRSACLEFAQC